MRVAYLDTEQINGSEDCISMYNRNLLITGWNRACEKKYGLSYDLVRNRPLLDIFPNSINDYRVACIREAAQQGKSFFFSNMIYNDGMGNYTQAIVPLRNMDGEITGALNIIRDLHEEKHFTKKDLLLPLLKSKYSQANIAHLLS